MEVVAVTRNTPYLVRRIEAKLARLDSYLTFGFLVEVKQYASRGGHSRPPPALAWICALPFLQSAEPSTAVTAKVHVLLP